MPTWATRAPPCAAPCRPWQPCRARGCCASSPGRSAPDAGGPDINAAAELDTTLAPLELLHALQRIEQAAGRERPYRNAPRTLDLDLLLYGTPWLDSAELTVPHPRMGERAFVLLPLAELALPLVDAQQLAAVAGQRMECVATAQQWLQN